MLSLYQAMSAHNKMHRVMLSVYSFSISETNDKIDPVLNGLICVFSELPQLVFIICHIRPNFCKLDKCEVNLIPPKFLSNILSNVSVLKNLQISSFSNFLRYYYINFSQRAKQTMIYHKPKIAVQIGVVHRLLLLLLWVA